MKLKNSLLFILALLSITGALVGYILINNTPETSPPPQNRVENKVRERELVAYAKENGIISQISWSPNGKRIAYTGEKGDIGDYYPDIVAIADLGGNGIWDFAGRFPSWGPNERYLAFSSIFNGTVQKNGKQDEGIALLDTNTSQVLRLTDSSTSSFLPSWSSDGERILFLQNSQQDPYQFQIWVMRKDGSEKKQLTIGSHKEWAKFSPDRSRILYLESTQDTEYSYHYELWVMDSNGENPRDLGIMNPLRVAWHPNGLAILFATGTDIRTIGLGGTNPQKLADGTDPNWSPDGSKIAFVKDGNIWLMDADGNNKVQLTTGDAQDALPTWSPNGKKIAFSRDSGLWFLEFVE